MDSRENYIKHGGKDNELNSSSSGSTPAFYGPYELVHEDPKILFLLLKTSLLNMVPLHSLVSNDIKFNCALASMAQLVGHYSVQQKVAGSIPGTEAPIDVLF